MEKLMELAQKVKQEYLFLLKQDIQRWAEEKGFALEQVTFEIESPDYEIGESDFSVKHVMLIVNGEKVGTSFIFEGTESKEYQLWRVWRDTLEKFKGYIEKKTREYEAATGFYNLLSFLENEEMKF